MSHVSKSALCRRFTWVCLLGLAILALAAAWFGQPLLLVAAGVACWALAGFIRSFDRLLRW
jgi:hypothetical protein